VNELFGIPLSGILNVLVALLGMALLSVAWVAWRRPVIFKMGVRNIPRRKAQTILIVVGLMLSTLIIAAALGTGDTLNYSTTSEVFKSLGHVDEVVVYSPDGEGDTSSSMSSTIDSSALGTVETALAGNDDVDGVMPVLWKMVPAINTASGLAEPEVGVTGVDPSRLDDFGGVRDLNGDMIDLAALSADQIVVNEVAADDLEAKVGDVITVYYGNRPLELTVAAIAEESVMSGSVEAGLPGMVLPLQRLQEITGLTDKISLVAISNSGGVRDSIEPTDAVVRTLETALAGTGLGVDPLKQDTVDQAEGLASLFTGLFLVLGLFSIAAGILLIVLIFTMLAAERRSEMGMARAVGTHRKQLIQQFVAEGSGYALLAGMVGAALGVAAAYGIGYGMAALIGDEISIEPHVEPRSLVVAYALGVVITFLAVVGSSWKISRLNVVAAVRDIPDVQVSKRSKKVILWGGLMLVGGGLLTMAGLSSETAFPFYAGMSLMPFGLALLARFLGAPARPVFTVVGLLLLVLWVLPQDTADKLFGELDGDMEMFFLSGIFMVIGATVLIVQNLDVLLKGVSAFSGLFKSRMPAVRTAIAYPGASRGRTGMTIAMFSLIVFSLVTISTMNKNYSALFLGDEAAAGWDVRADSMSSNPVGDVTAALNANGVDTSEFTATGVVTTPNPYAARLRMGGTTDWKAFEVRGMDQTFIESSDLIFSQKAEGYDSDEAIVTALMTQPNVAIIDSWALDGGEDGMGGGDDENFILTGVEESDKTFAPATIEVINPQTNQPATLTVIGVLDSRVSTLNGLFANQATIDTIYPEAVLTSYYVSLTDDSRSEAVAKQIESTLLMNGVQATSIVEELEDDQRQSSNFLHIIEGFMGLGLIVGIAAVGVIAFRSVVERRQQIGVLRALGFQKQMVSLSFLVETAFVVGMGVISGTVLGLVLARSLFTSEDAASDASFLVPWAMISLILTATVAVALLMAWIPSRQAASIAPAEALRYE
jgi:putative ABC transport system permease protein